VRGFLSRRALRKALAKRISEVRAAVRIQACARGRWERRAAAARKLQVELANSERQDAEQRAASDVLLPTQQALDVLTSGEEIFSAAEEGTFSPSAPRQLRHEAATKPTGEPLAGELKLGDKIRGIWASVKMLPPPPVF